MTTYRFGRCTLHVTRREVIVAGQLRPTPPKVFDLLVLLLRERHRMVSKQDLVDALWQGSVLSESTLARTVMLARRAIDDEGSANHAIRNLHGRGYRFVADVEEHPDEARPNLGSARRRLHRLALCRRSPPTVFGQERRAGQGELLALVGDALTAAGFEVITPTIGDAGPGLTAPGWLDPRRAREALRSLEAQHLVLADLHGRDGLALDYHVIARHGPGFGGSLRDETPAGLAARLAREIVGRLDPAAARNPDSGAPQAALSQLRQRAEAAMAAEQWADAEVLWHAASLLDPASLALRERRLQAMRPLADARLAALTLSLLDESEGQGATALADRLRWRLAGPVMLPLPPAAGVAAEAAAAEAAGAEAVDGVELERWLAQAQLALQAGQLDAARAWAERTDAAAQASGATELSARARLQVAWLEMHGGEFLRAQQALQALADEHLARGRPVSAAEALAWQASCCIELGLQSEGLAKAARAVELIEPMAPRGRIAEALAIAALVLAEQPLQPRLAALQQRFTGGPIGVAGRAAALLLQGLLSLQAGDRPHALGRLHAARQLALRTGATLLARQLLPWLLRLHLACGQWRRAQRLARQARERPEHRQDFGLQAALHHALACAEAMRGRQADAAILLHQVIEEFPGTRAHAQARLDMAAIQLARGDLDRAARLLGGCGAWRRQAHWQAVEARLQALRNPATPTPPGEPAADRPLETPWPSLQAWPGAGGPEPWLGNHPTHNASG